VPKPFHLVVLALLVWSITSASAQRPLLERLGAPEGLSQGMIYDLLQDRRGFLWFATKDGLNRYDGYSFKVFQNDPFQPFSLSDNEVLTIMEDRNGRIWAGTANNGINIYDPERSRFYHLNILESQIITCFTQALDGAVWAGTANGVYRIILPDQLPASDAELQSGAKVDAFHWEQVTSQKGVFGNRVEDIHYASDGKIWVSTYRIIGYFDPKSQSFSKVLDIPPGEDLQNNACTFNTGPDGALWIGQPGQLMRIKDGQTSIFTFPEKSPYPYTILVFDPQGDLYISTRKQLYKLHKPSTVQPGQANFQLIYRFPDTGVMGSTKMCVDQSGLLWIGTNGYGFYKYKPRNSSFRHYLAGKSPRRIAIDAQGRKWVWLADKAFGLLSESREDGHADLIMEPGLLEHDLISDDQHLWLLGEQREGGLGEGLLVRFNIQSLKEETRYELPMTTGVYSRIFQGRHGNFWILGNKSVLGSFDPQTGRCDTFSFGPITGFQESSLALAEDSDGSLWIGTPHGLLQLKPGSKPLQYQIFKTNPLDRHGMNCNSVLSLLNDPLEPQRYLWIGTKGGGLSRLDKKTLRFTHYTIQDGLPNNVVYGILSDQSGSLWLSTNRGLSRFDPEERRFQNFFSVDGLQDDEFNTISAARGLDGRLWFGGVNGISAFYPDSLTGNLRSPKVWITRLQINDQPATVANGMLEKSLLETASIILSHNQNLLSIEFAAMDFAAPHMNQFRYRLLGAGTEWVEPTTSNTATYAHLSPGKYVFEVITGGSRGIWTGEPTRLEICILPPWYQTTWAYMLFLLLVLGSVWSLYRFQINRARLHNKLAYEQKEAQRLAELDRLKTNFFNSVTHEFRTPLTLLLEPVRQLIAEVKDKSTLFRLELVDRNARRLLQYVNQLLDLSKLEAGQMPLDARPVILADITREIADPFNVLAEQKNILLKTNLTSGSEPVLLDRLHWEQVVTNLLSNALKFTDSGGEVTLELTEHSLQEGAESDVSLLVRDTGIGIASDELPHIFDRFYQAKHGRGGTGIGLALCKELVTRMGGDIEADSVPGKGTEFRVRLRLKHFSQSSEWDNTSAKEDTKSNGNTSMLKAEHPLLLLVEDDVDLRRFLRASLPSEYRIAEAATGSEGIQMALELVPDLIISDWVMPEKTGLELASTLKKNPTTSHIPLILLTAKSGIEARVTGLEYGADVFLSKPFRADELVANVRNLLAARLRLREYFSQPDRGDLSADMANGSVPRQESEFIQRLIQVIEENLDNESMDADAFARAMFLSRSQLHRKIHALTGISLTEFVRNQRLDRAREMLARREGSISEVAWRAGFPNSKYFSTCFKERFGVTPSGYLAGEKGILDI
jgi:signal transduction histidine kinase/ligand-binding sensor domain-containing protein/DNA-binding response OmpR family regulator